MLWIKPTKFQLVIMAVACVAAAFGSFEGALAWGSPTYRAVIIAVLAALTCALVLYGVLTIVAARKTSKEYEAAAKLLLNQYVDDRDAHALTTAVAAWVAEGHDPGATFMLMQDAGDLLAEDGRAEQAYAMLSGIDADFFPGRNKRDFLRYRGVMEQRARIERSRVESEERLRKSRKKRHRK